MPLLWGAWLSLAADTALAQANNGTAGPAANAAANAATAPAPNFGGGLVQLLGGLIVVLGLLVGALWLLKQLTQRRGGNSAWLRVVAGTAVGPRERVVIVEVGSTWLVLGVAPGRVNALAEIPRQADAAAATVAAAAGNAASQGGLAGALRRAATTVVSNPARTPPAPSPSAPPP